MKHRITYLKNYLFFLLLSFICCNEYNKPIVNPPDDPVEQQKIRIDTIWTEIIPSHNDNTISRKSIIPIIHENKVIVSSYDLLSTEYEVVSCFDKVRGNLQWSWKEYVPYQYGVRLTENHDRNFCIIDNKLLLPAENGNYLLNLENGKTVDFRSFRFGNTNIFGSPNTGFSTFEDMLLRVFVIGGLPLNSSTVLYESSKEDIGLTEVFRIDSAESYCPEMCTPVLVKNSNHELLIIGTIRYLGTDWYSEKGEVYCYNYSTKKIVWHLKNFTGKADLINLFSDTSDNFFYFIAGRNFYCLDIKDGKVLWTTKIDEKSISIVDKFSMYNNKLYIPLSDGNISCLDALTGQIIWQNASPKVAASGDLFITEEYIFQCDKRLCVLDRNNGELLKIFRSPMQSSKYNDTFIENMTVDPETGLLYFTDGYFLICAKLTKL